MICQLCGEEKKLIQSHIIPRSFYKSAHLLNNCTLVNKYEHSKPLPIGIYDMEIVCDDCEIKFSTWDDYGNKFFNEILPNSKNIIRKDGKDIALLIHGINYVRLKLFLLSVLWRASTSKDSFFEGVSVGPFESKLKENILTADPTNIEEFSVIISKFNLLKYDILHPPYKVRLENGLNGYKFFFFNAEVFIKVDRRPIGHYGSLILRPNKPLIVSFQEPPTVIKLLNDLRPYKN